jgi:hypothetical protein
MERKFGTAADPESGTCATREAPKNFGDALLHPREFISICRTTYFVFFFAFFFAGILFSSKLFEFSRQHCWRSAYSFSCIVIPIYLVKKKVMLWQKKMKNPTSESAKIENRRRDAPGSLPTFAPVKFGNPPPDAVILSEHRSWTHPRYEKIVIVTPA